MNECGCMHGHTDIWVHRSMASCIDVWARRSVGVEMRMTVQMSMLLVHLVGRRVSNVRVLLQLKHYTSDDTAQK